MQATLNSFFAPKAAPRYVFTIGSLLNSTGPGTGSESGPVAPATHTDAARTLMDLAKGEARKEARECIDLDADDESIDIDSGNDNDSSSEESEDSSIVSETTTTTDSTEAEDENPFGPDTTKDLSDFVAQEIALGLKIFGKDFIEEICTRTEEICTR